MKKRMLAMSLGICLLVLPILPVTAGSSVVDPKTAMVELISQLHSYAQQKQPGFYLLTNNGLGLYANEDGSDPALAARMLQSIDGIVLEEFSYGWEMKDDTATPRAVQQAMLDQLRQPRAAGLPVFNIDYCQLKKHRDISYRQSGAQGFINYAAERRSLNKIPLGKVSGENQDAINTLAAAKNFLVLLNPELFADKSSYLAALSQSDYDLLIIDPMYNGEFLSVAELRQLQHKPGGARRLVVAYMSVGEAEDYRLYWQRQWEALPPEWLEMENKDWQGNYKVKYWQIGWQQLLYGSDSSTLDQILQAGFDGAFLDVVDAYQYFVDEAESK